MIMRDKEEVAKLIREVFDAYCKSFDDSLNWLKYGHGLIRRLSFTNLTRSIVFSMLTRRPVVILLLGWNCLSIRRIVPLSPR